MGIGVGGRAGGSGVMVLVVVMYSISWCVARGSGGVESAGVTSLVCWRLGCSSNLIGLGFSKSVFYGTATLFFLCFPDVFGTSLSDFFLLSRGWVVRILLN